MRRSSLWQQLSRTFSSRTRKVQRRRERAMFLEALEERHLLATVSVVPDIIGVGEYLEGIGFARWKVQRDGPTTNSLTVNFSISGTAFEGFDFETVTQPVTIPSGSSYEYVYLYPLDDIFYEVTESVVLTITQGSGYTIGNPSEASLAIYDDDPIGAPLDPLTDWATVCNCTCPCQNEETKERSNSASGDHNTQTQNTGGKQSSNAASNQITVGFNAEFTEQAPEAEDIEVKTWVNDVEGQTRHYSPGDIEPGEQYQLMVANDVVEDLGLEHDGYYKWEAELNEYYADGYEDITRETEGGVKVVNFAGGEFGKGWQPVLVDRLQVQPEGDFDFAGALWIRGDYNAWWFSELDGVYSRELGEPDYSTLEAVGDDFVLRKKDGEQLLFEEVDDNLYMLTVRTDRNGNETHYTYINADGLDGDDEIKTITDPAGHVTTFNYAGSKVSSITDPFDRDTLLAYTDGNLTSIT